MLPNFTTKQENLSANLSTKRCMFLSNRYYLLPQRINFLYHLLHRIAKHLKESGQEQRIYKSSQQIEMQNLLNDVDCSKYNLPLHNSHPPESAQQAIFHKGANLFCLGTSRDKSLMVQPIPVGKDQWTIIAITGLLLRSRNLTFIRASSCLAPLFLSLLAIFAIPDGNSWV